MALRFIDPAFFGEFLRGGNRLIITANNRIRAHLLRALALEETALGVLEAPPIYTLSQYADTLWRERQLSLARHNCTNATASDTAAPRRLITADQRRYLWQQLISSSDLGQGLLQAKPLAQQADAAYRYLALWQLTPAQLTEGQFALPDNCLQLLEWIAQFEAALDTHQLLTHEQLLVDLIADYPTATAEQPSALLVGFDDVPPLHQRLIDKVFREHQFHLASGTPSPHARRVEFETQDEELRAAASWIGAILRNDSEARIALIVPNLGQCRDQVERSFTRLLVPQTLHPDHGQWAPPFNFSAGVPLGGTPIIACALSLLQWFERDWPLDVLCNLLHSPFWLDEGCWTAPLTRRLRHAQRLTLNAAAVDRGLDALLRKAEAHSSLAATIAQVQARFIRARGLANPSRGRQPLGFWVDWVPQLLDALNWPGPRALDSIEHQQVAHFYQLLERTLELARVAPRMSLREFVGELSLMAHNTPFQAQTPLSQVQILGALESAGLEFTHAWVMGLHNRQWPAAPAPNPFLPVALQRDQGMPHASAERELRFAESLTAHFLRCAEQLVISSPRRLDDQTLAPSPLICALPAVSPSTLFAAADTVVGLDEYARALLSTNLCERITDTQAPPVTARESLRGGASIIREQAACPFNAFARYRLGASNPAAPVAGIAPADRGNLLHNTLADIWGELKSHAGLVALTPEARRTLIDHVLTRHLNALASLRGLEDFSLIVEAEQRRAQALIEQWLTLEAARVPFVVHSIEAPISVNFAGLPLQLRLDRIDELAQGGRMLIDYKTGSPSAADWDGPRPKDPQLPLYALISEPGPSALAFARLNARGVEFIGRGIAGGQPQDLAQVDDWPEQLQLWRQSLEQLVGEFLRGDAPVRFASDVAKRNGADLRALNRHLG